MKRHRIFEGTPLQSVESVTNDELTPMIQACFNGSSPEGMMVAAGSLIRNVIYRLPMYYDRNEVYNHVDDLISTAYISILRWLKRKDVETRKQTAAYLFMYIFGNAIDYMATTQTVNVPRRTRRRLNRAPHLPEIALMDYPEWVMIDLIDSVAKTERQKAYCELRLQGMSKVEIAETWGVSINQVMFVSKQVAENARSIM